MCAQSLENRVGSDGVYSSFTETGVIAISYRHCSNRAKALPKQYLSGCSRATSLKRRARLLTFTISASRCRGPRLTACSNFNLCFKYETCRKASPSAFIVAENCSETKLCLLSHFYLPSELLSVRNENQFVFKFFFCPPRPLSKCTISR